MIPKATELCDNTGLTGQQLALIGMDMALTHANQVKENWGSDAYDWFLRYINHHGIGHQFQTEDVRAYAESNGFTAPPSLRAWGSIVVKVAKAGYIVSAGYAKVTNAKAHSTPATLWEVVSIAQDKNVA